MKKIRILLFSVISLFFSMFVEGGTPFLYQSKYCKGISFQFDQKQLKEYDTYSGFIFTQVDTIVEQLDYNLDTMWLTFLAISESDSNRFPSCLREALIRLQGELCNGNKTITIKWALDGSSWFNVHLQKYFGQLHGSNPNSREINLYDIYKTRFLDNGLCKIQKPGRSMTSAVMFHEFIHCVKKNYPDCFQKLSRDMDELSTQCCEIALFGFENGTSHYLEKTSKSVPTKGWCNFQNVCGCGPGCPDENPSSGCGCCCKK